MAASTSAGVASGISAMTSSVDGSYTGMRLAEALSLSSPLISMASGLICVTGMIPSSDSLLTGPGKSRGRIDDLLRSGCGPERIPIEQIGRSEDEHAPDDKLYLIKPDRTHLARGDKRDDQPDGSSDQSRSAVGQQVSLWRAERALLIERMLEQSAEQVAGGQHLQNHSEIEQGKIRLANGYAKKAHQCEQRGQDGINDQADIRCLITRMYP